MSESYLTHEGRPYPLGAGYDGDGVNFAIFSANAEKIELCLFDELGQVEIARINLHCSTDQVWHVYIQDLQPGALYGYRVYGPYEPHHGHRFNPNKLLLDPYARKIDGMFRWSNVAYGYDIENPHQDLIIDTRDNAKDMPKCVVMDPKELIFDDEESGEYIHPRRPIIPWRKTIVYETHVRGFTQLNLAVPANQRGTFAGLSHPEVLNYIKSIGVTTIELLPVQAFVDEHFLVTQGLSNYWGYNTLHFFAPFSGYMSSGSIREFKSMVRAIHDAGLEVVMDVVYNHTAEGNHLGPTLSFRGIDNASYYCLQSHDARYYANDTGCGNTINIKHPRVLQMVMDSLRYWAGDLGVDGFRFDLATVMGREAHGFDPGSGFFDAIKQDPILTQCKMIAEPWDIGPGGYQLGNYPTGWAEWNDRYRDTCRRFWRGEPGVLPEFARRIHGSSDLFEHSGRTPSASVNFIASHDGFTLEDLVSYKNRNNFDNKEQNKDGHHANFSDNHGVEGATDDAKIIALREKQKRNFIATLFLSQGTPMLLAGDEMGRSQGGNNNAYCQDNEINWLDWQALNGRDRDLQLFTSYVINLRNQYRLLTSKRYIHKPDEPDDRVDCCVRWISVSGEEMTEEQWSEHELKHVGWVLERMSTDETRDLEKIQLIVFFNAGEESIEFLPPTQSDVSQWNYLLSSESSDGVPIKKILNLDDSLVASAKSMHLLAAVFE